MRACRRCGTAFQPAKPFYFWCSLVCRKADYLEAQAEPYSASDVGRAFDKGYDRGYAAGLAEGQRQTRPIGSKGQAREPLPLDLWRQLAHLAHPDRFQGSPLEPIAHEVMVWLNQHRPEG
jgi:hypothetical protein